MGFVKCRFYRSPPSRSAKTSIGHALAPAYPQSRSSQGAQGAAARPEPAPAGAALCPGQAGNGLTPRAALKPPRDVLTAQQ